MVILAIALLIGQSLKKYLRNLRFILLSIELFFEEEISKEERQQLIKDSGYDFFAEEWQQAMAEIQAASSNEELKEKELEAISGGLGLNPFGSMAIYGVIMPDDVLGWF